MNTYNIRTGVQQRGTFIGKEFSWGKNPGWEL